MDIVSNLYAGYGEQPQQQLITAQGKAYLDKNFPKLDSIKSAAILPPEGAAPAAATTATKAAAPATKSTAVARKSTAPATKSTAVARKSTAPATKSTAAPAKQ
jgi:hypothetical protein